MSPEMMTNKTRWSNPNVRRLVGWLTFAACIVGMHAMDMHLVVLPESQWDFEGHYYAYHVYQNGGDPYDNREVTALAGKSLAWPWAYPPHTFYFFKLFAERPLTAEQARQTGDPRLGAKQLFLIAKLICLAVLILIWTFVFIKPGGRGWFLAFITLGFNAAIGRDVVGGNVSTFEQLAIWIGVAALLWRVPAVFCVCIILASQFKFLPLGLLGLLWFVPWGRRWRYVVFCAVLIAANAAFVYWLDPEAAAKTLRASAALARSEHGLGNPCVLPVLGVVTRWMWDLFPQIEGLPGRPIVPALYVAFVIITLVVTFKRLPFIKAPRTRLFVGIVTYLLVAPRVRDYSWCLILPPCFELVRLWVKRPTTPAWILVLVVLALALPGLNELSMYRPYLLAWLVWAVTLFRPLDDAPRSELEDGVEMEVV